MRVLLVSWKYPPYGDGAEKQAELLATALGRAGDSVTVLTLPVGQEPTVEQRGGVVIRRVPNLPRLPLIGGALRQAFRYAYVVAFVGVHRRDYQVLQSMFGTQLGAIAVGSAWLFGLPSVARMATGGDWNDFKELRSWPKRSLGPLLAPLLKLADRFVVLTDDSHASLAREVPVSRIRTIPNAVELPSERWASDKLSARRARLGPAADRPFVFAAGRLVATKGFDVLLRAVAAGSLGRVCLAGEGPLASELAKLAADLGVDLKLLGRLPRAEVPQWMLAASAVAAPSYIEGISNTILEAVALGCPVVASRISGNLAVIEAGVSGLLVEPGDVEGLAAAIQSVVTDPASAERLGQAARERTAATFGIEPLVRRYHALYAEVTHPGATGCSAPGPRA